MGSSFLPLCILIKGYLATVSLAILQLINDSSLTMRIPDELRCTAFEIPISDVSSDGGWIILTTDKRNFYITFKIVVLEKHDTRERRSFLLFTYLASVRDTHILISAKSRQEHARYH